MAKKLKPKKLLASKKKPKAKLKKAKSKLTNLTAKRQEVRYRDKRGRLVKPEKINGKKYIKWEIWRYSENTRHWKKLDFGKKWESKYIKRKKPLTKTQVLLIVKRRYSRHKIKIKKINGEIFAFTASP